MQSTSIPTTAAPDPETVAMLAAMAARRGLTLEPAALTAAATLDSWLAPYQRELRNYELSFLDLVEPATVFQWIERGGRSAASPAPVGDVA